jgi:hypothetical protein
MWILCGQWHLALRALPAVLRIRVQQFISCPGLTDYFNEIRSPAGRKASEVGIPVFFIVAYLKPKDLDPAFNKAWDPFPISDLVPNLDLILKVIKYF